MRYVKIVGLMAVAVTALMAFAATASATTLTSPTGNTYTSTITAVQEGPLILHGPFTDVSCQKSHVEGKVEQHGSGVTVKGKISTLSFTECNFAVTVEATGSLEIHPVKTNASTNKVEACTGIECTGTLTSTGTKVLIATSIGNCGYETTNTDLGLVTPSNDFSPESTATLDIGAHETGKIPRTYGSAGFLCGSTGQWTGTYLVTTPDRLYIDS